LNVLSLLLIALGVYVLCFLGKRKLDSNLPLVFYGAVFAFVRYSERDLHPYIFFGGLIVALLLRFEFMNRLFTTMALSLEMLAIGAIAAKLFGDAFGLQF